MLLVQQILKNLIFNSEAFGFPFQKNVPEISTSAAICIFAVFSFFLTDNQLVFHVIFFV